MGTNIKTDYDATQKTNMQFNGNPVYTKADTSKNVHIIKAGDTVIMTREVFEDMLKMLKYARKIQQLANSSRNTLMSILSLLSRIRTVYLTLHNNIKGEPLKALHRSLVAAVSFMYHLL